jgi:enamine deaminase RidA (YjgF/YER057c/UK114 family)
MLAAKASIAWSGSRCALGRGEMTVRPQAAQAQILAALARIRAILDEVGAEAQRTATQQARLAAWHARRGEAHAARSQRQAAAVQQLRLADLDAALDALDLVAVVALDRDPATTPPLPRTSLALPPVAFVTAADSFLNDQSEPGPTSRLTATE